MALSNVLQTPAAGFNFDNAARNTALEGLFDGGETPKPLKTGTTIAGVVFKDGVVLGADTRATSSEVVADKMYHGQIGANLILGGVDCTGNHLYTVGPYGSVNKVPYLSMGSGDLAALAILEDGFKPNLELETAKELVRASIHAGIMSDLGSGNNIDICVITREGVDYIRPYQESEFKDNR
uniref:Proteasome 20S subunit beta 13a n=1 Tax=Acanthochromis polyacanthus TaxID=80966 RepID=A0A3Q1G9L4_9TELE